MHLQREQYKILKEEYDKDYLPFDHGFLEIVTKKIKTREPPHLKFRELWQIDAWKNGMRNYHNIEKNSEEEVAKTTREALSVADKDVKLSLTMLVNLEGVGIPVASAILFFAFPEKFVVIDKYAWNAYRVINKGEQMIDWESPFKGGPEQYEEFSRFCKNEAEELKWTPRDVEKALFKYGENKGKIEASSEG